MEKLFPEVKTSLPGPKGKALIERDQRHASTSYIKEYPLVVDRAEGCWIYDLDGNRFLDMMAGIAVASTGHCHPKVVEAIKRQAEKFMHICATDFYYEPFTRLTEKLATYVPKMGARKTFLTNSGTEAVEGAIKLARYHTRRTNLIAFKGAFHGRTYGALSMNCSKNTQRAFFGPFLPGVTHVPYPNPYRCPYANTAKECSGEGCECGNVLEKDTFVSLMNPKEVAAIVVEPIQGEGGYIVPPKKFLQNLRRLCDEHGICLIFDEVQCGAGRTGHMYAAECFDVAPDILVTSKGLGSGMPIGAFMVREKFMTWPSGSHGSTFGGNPVCCAAAVATLEIVEELLPHVRKMGDFFKKGLHELARKHPELGDVRGEGLMIGAEFVDLKTKEPAVQLVDDLVQEAFKKGLCLLGAGKSTIRFCPPLIITEHEISIGLKILDECLVKLKK